MAVGALLGITACSHSNGYDKGRSIECVYGPPTYFDSTIRPIEEVEPVYGPPRIEHDSMQVKKSPDSTARAE